MKPLPGHIEDQLHAAIAETETRLVEGEFSSSVADERSEALVAKLLAGAVELCPHIDLDRPRPVWVSSWAPTRVACDLCAVAGWIPAPDLIESSTCDFCHQYQPGLTTKHLITVGPISVRIRRCRSCSGEPLSPKE